MSFWSPDPSVMANALSEQHFQAAMSKQVNVNLMAQTQASVQKTIEKNRAALASPPAGSVVASAPTHSVVMETFQDAHPNTDCVNLDSEIVTTQKLEPAETKEECKAKCNAYHPVVSLGAVNCTKACLGKD